MNTHCPACGCEHLEASKSQYTLPMPYGSPAFYEETLEKCPVCGESGDFSGINDALLEQALNAAKNQSVANMLGALAQDNIKMAYMERALGLPARTMTRWKNEGISAAPLALLRIIRTYPWLLEVADAQFEELAAKTKMVEAAMQSLKDLLQHHSVRVQASQAYPVADNQAQLDFSVQFNCNYQFSREAIKPRAEIAMHGSVK